MWTDVYGDFSDLTKSEQLALFETMKRDLFPDDPNKVTSLLKSIREARFASGSVGLTTARIHQLKIG